MADIVPDAFTWRDAKSNYRCCVIVVVVLLLVSYGLQCTHCNYCHWVSCARKRWTQSGQGQEQFRSKTWNFLHFLSKTEEKNNKHGPQTEDIYIRQPIENRSGRRHRSSGPSISLKEFWPVLCLSCAFLCLLTRVRAKWALWSWGKNKLFPTMEQLVPVRVFMFGLK